MNQTALRYFIAVAAAGSIREGAEHLRIAQSAISRQIIGLESELGVRLLERKPRGIELTAAGEMFLRFAKDGIAQLGRMRSELAGLKRMSSGLVRLAATESFAHRLLPSCSARFSAEYPGVGIDVQVNNGPGVLDAVRKGDAALGLSFNVDEDDVTILSSVKDPLVALVRPSHPLAALKDITLKELAGIDLTVPSPSTASRRSLEEAAAEAGIVLQTVLESDSTQLRLSFAAASDTVAVVSRVIASQWEDSDDLCCVPIRDKLLHRLRVDIFVSTLREIPIAAAGFAAVLGEGLLQAAGSALPEARKASAPRRAWLPAHVQNGRE